MQKHFKLLDGKLEEAPANYRNYINFNLDEASMLKEGYKPVKFDIDLIGEFIEHETEIVQEADDETKINYWLEKILEYSAENTKNLTEKLTTVYELQEGGCCLNWLPIYMKVLQDVKIDVLDGSKQTIQIPIIPSENKKGTTAKVTANRLQEIINELTEQYKPIVENFSKVHSKLNSLKTTLRRNSMPEQLGELLSTEVLEKVYDDKQIKKAIDTLRKFNVAELWAA